MHSRGSIIWVYKKKNYAINHWTEKFSMSKISLSKHIVHCPRGPTFLPSFCFFFSECRSGDKNLVKQKKVLKTSKKKKMCAIFCITKNYYFKFFFCLWDENLKWNKNKSIVYLKWNRFFFFAFMQPTVHK